MVNSTYGIVLDGDVAVGKFLFVTKENKLGYREILRLDLNTTYIDVVNGKSLKNLRCILVEDIPENEFKNTPKEMENPFYVKILEDLGFGIFQGKVKLNDNQAHYQKAIFSKAVKSLDPTMN